MGVLPLFRAPSFRSLAVIIAARRQRPRGVVISICSRVFRRGLSSSKAVCFCFFLRYRCVTCGLFHFFLVPFSCSFSVNIFFVYSSRYLFHAYRVYRTSVTGLPATQAGLAKSVLPNGGGAPRIGSSRRRSARGMGGERAAHNARVETEPPTTAAKGFPLFEGGHHSRVPVACAYATRDTRMVLL